ncbi:MAG: TRAP transporter substrate-binding protein DctP [Gemmobacter sp.]
MHPRNVLSAAVFGAAIATSSVVSAENLRLLSSWDTTYNAVPVFVDAYIDRVAQLSGGAITITMQGPETVPPFEQLQPVSAGLFDMLFTHGAYHLGETAMAFGMDAVVDDPKVRRESGIYDLIDEHYAKKNMKLLGAFSAASGYHIMLREPLAGNGLQGLRIRASGTYHDLVTTLGGSVVTLPASEIYSALERGVVDGAAWPVFGAMDYRWYEVADYMTRPTFGINNHTLFINLDRWNALSPEHQAVLVRAAEEIEIEGRAKFEELWAAEEKAMIEAGLAITEFDADTAARIEGIFAEGVWRQVEARAGEDGVRMHALAREKGITAQ